LAKVSYKIYKIYKSRSKKIKSGAKEEGKGKGKGVFARPFLVLAELLPHLSSRLGAARGTAFRNRRTKDNNYGDHYTFMYVYLFPSLLAQAGQSRRGTLNRLHAGSGGREAAGTAAGALGDTIATDY
jgi:hypothetical protein